MSDTAEEMEQVPATIPCTDPATGERLGEAPSLNAEEVAERIERARRAQKDWRGTPFSERRRVLKRLLDLILENDDELCEQICRDAGKTLHNAMIGEIWPICEKLRWTIKYGERHLSPEHVSSGLLVHKRATIEYQPLGVVGVICPWNFPLQNILGPTIPALFAGNAVIAKVSEWVSWSADPFEKLIQRALVDCGYPADLVQVITGYADTGAALVSGGVDKIVFTGSMRNGKRVVAESAESLTPVILELGGKDPMIVCDDAELDQAAHAAASGTFIASGQMCLAAERVLVFDSVYDDFLDRVRDIALRLRQGPPLRGKLVDVGAMTMPAQIDIVDALVQDAIAKGARLICGGKRAKIRKGSKQFYEPTVLADVTPEMNIWRDEAFGPVMSIARVQNESEAVRLANDTAYGLSSSVFSRDHDRAKRIASQLRAGSSCVNDWAVMYMANDLPFGGVDSSGFGRLNGRDGLRAMANAKSVITDKLPLHRAIKLFPGRRGDYEVTRSTVRMLYADGISDRIKHGIDLLRALKDRI